MTTMTIPLPWVLPPLSMNDRQWTRAQGYARSRKIREIKADILLLARVHKLPRGVDYVTVQLHYQPPTRVRRDTDNLTATAKPIYDALAAGTVKHPGYGMVRDDTPEFMAKPEPIIHPADGRANARMWLELTWEQAG